MKTKDNNYYINLPYTIQTVKNNDGTYFISVKELAGCMSEGDSLEEAYKMIREAMAAWMEVALAEKRDIPLPESMDEHKYSGKIVLRMSKTLHKELTWEAKDEGVSLNHYMTELLAGRHQRHTILHSIDKYSRA